ncbi:MAG: DsbA family protein [Patescibacteria group bacterium]
MEENKKNIFLPLSILIGAVLISGALIYNAGIKSFGGDKDIPNEQQSGDPEKMAEITSADYVRGNRNASVKLVVFEDLECPFCKQFHETLAEVSREYGDKVAIVWRHFPLDIHPKAAKEAEAAECVGELGGNDKFWAFIDKIFEITPSNNGLDLAELSKTAVILEIDKAKFETCLNSNKYSKKIQDAVENAIASGGTGTPYSIIIGKDGKKNPVSGALPFAQIKIIIEESLR